MLFLDVGNFLRFLERDAAGDKLQSDQCLERLKKLIRRMRIRIPVDVQSIPDITEDQIANIENLDSTIMWIWRALSTRSKNGEYKIPESLIESLSGCSFALRNLQGFKRYR